MSIIIVELLVVCDTQVVLSRFFDIPSINFAYGDMKNETVQKNQSLEHSGDNTNHLGCLSIVSNDRDVLCDKRHDNENSGRGSVLDQTTRMV